MAKFQPAVDLWDNDTRAALDAGTLRLQPGQWIRTGSVELSRFYSHNPATGHVVAFHGPDGIATRKLRQFVAGQREARNRAIRREVARACRDDEIPPHVRARRDASGKTLNHGGAYPVWSGRGAVPTVGSEVRTQGIVSHVCCVTGYEVCDGWLMLRGYRVADPRKTGNLAGAEIL